jgi:hypothetical protein
MRISLDSLLSRLPHHILVSNVSLIYRFLQTVGLLLAPMLTSHQKAHSLNFTKMVMERLVRRHFQMLTDTYVCLFAWSATYASFALIRFCCPYIDSGHFVIKGRNEVVMLRRMSERHKLDVANLLARFSNYDALYQEPHDDGQVGGRVCRRISCVFPHCLSNSTSFFCSCSCSCPSAGASTSLVHQ